ncbi:type VI secretion system lipoprotein TssJ [Aquisalimonas lutea]|uniref:type VI secretion system lipoprotein TssJ n=1 Tax=Aquisalimonas lutea TaxID=1327750 RepID=UPI0025B34D50|nr:type VI secretion system lipoprotein TssJ [Aquisalimonas lutea]MDN3519585.1 type VI secretion system lipoprotein TssJ [Aquisalimonas lutea]
MAYRIIIVVLLSLLASSCGLNRYVDTPTDDLTLVASEDVNPDVDGRPSPVVVRVYQLTDRNTFDTLDFRDAFGNAESLLGRELKGAAEFTLRPGESLEHTTELAGDASHMAVVAGYRAIDAARWKLVYSVSPNWYSDHRVTLTADGLILGEPDGEAHEVD